MTYVRKRTSRKPFVIGGVEWRCYQTGINAYTTYSSCERAAVWRPSHRLTHRATVDGVSVGNLYRSEQSACAAAAKVLRKKRHRPPAPPPSTSTVWKFQLSPVVGAIDMPKDAQPVHFAIQGETPCVWAIVDPNQDAERTEERTFLIAGTGHPVPENGLYIGTCHHRAFVWHLFELR